MKKYKRNRYSIDYLIFCKLDNLYITIALLFFTIALLIAGLILLTINENKAIIALSACGMSCLATIFGFFAYLKFKRLINKILDSLSDEEKNDVAFLMSIDCRAYLKKNYKDTDENEDLDN